MLPRSTPRAEVYNELHGMAAALSEWRTARTIRRRRWCTICICGCCGGACEFLNRRAFFGFAAGAMRHI